MQIVLPSKSRFDAPLVGFERLKSHSVECLTSRSTAFRISRALKISKIFSKTRLGTKPKYSRILFHVIAAIMTVNWHSKFRAIGREFNVCFSFAFNSSLWRCSLLGCRFMAAMFCASILGNSESGLKQIVLCNSCVPLPTLPWSERTYSWSE